MIESAGEYERHRDDALRGERNRGRLQARMHIGGGAPEQSLRRHRVEHAGAGEDVAVQSADRRDDDHGGGEVGASRTDQCTGRIGSHQRRSGDACRAEDDQIGGVQAQVERCDDRDRGEGGERQVALGPLHLAAHVADGDPSVEGGERTDQARRYGQKANGAVHRRNHETAPGPGASAERQDDEAEHHGDLRKRDEVLGDDALAHAEDVERGEPDDGRGGEELHGSRGERQEMAAVAGERNRHGGDRGGLDDRKEGPPVEESPEGSESAAQVDVQPSRLGHRRAQLGDRQGPREREERRDDPCAELQQGMRQGARDVARGEEHHRSDHHAHVDHRGVERTERAAQAGHVQPARRVSKRWKWWTPCSRAGE